VQSLQPYSTHHNALLLAAEFRGKVPENEENRKKQKGRRRREKNKKVEGRKV